LIFVAIAGLALTQAAAVCTGTITQHGDEGPWTGEVTNTSAQTVHGVVTRGVILDANDLNLWGTVDVRVCPSKLLPGERGAFELDMFDADFNPLAGTPPDYETPLHARFAPVATETLGTGPLRGDGLFVHEVGRDPMRGTVDVDLWNNSGDTYRDVTICAVRLDDTRKPADIAWFTTSSSSLRSGDMINVTLQFDSYGADASIRYHALGEWDAHHYACCLESGASGWQTIDTGPFSVMVPPGWAYEPLQGIDSFIGHFYSDQGDELFFDFGWYSNSLAPYGDPDHRVYDETVSGRIAKMVFADSLDGLVGVYFYDVDYTPSQFAPDMRTSLQMSGTGLDQEQRDIALQIFRSIRFEER
jgi:hypothetical protein